jgi:hypothetical protein
MRLRNATVHLEHPHGWPRASSLLMESVLRFRGTKFLIPSAVDSAGGTAMGRAYSQDLRERVMAAVDSGAGAYAAASNFRVSVSYIYKVLGRRKRTGQTSARP